MRTIEVTRVERGENGWPFGPVLEFSMWLAQQIANIPPQYLPSATAEIVDGYDGDPPKLVIEYQRPVTQQDRDEDAALAKKLTDHRRAVEYVLYLNLKKKYDPS